MDASLAVAEAATAAAFSDLSFAAVDGAKRGLMDTVGVSLAATGLGEDAGPIVDLVRENGGRPEATVIGYGGRTSAADAAFVFGALTHMLDYDDIVDSAVTHPSAAVVAAVFPLAERIGSVSGTELLTAVAIGQDLNVRLNLALRHHPPYYGWLPSINTIFGATLAAAKILRLNADQAHAALGLAMHQAGGSRQAGAGLGSSFRGIRDGFNARTAVVSALLAQRGLRGDRDAFEGRYGLFNLHFRGDYDREPLFDDLGTEFRGALAGQKPWPSCRFSHLFISPLLGLLRKHDLHASDIAQITAVSNDDLLEDQCEPHDIRARPLHVIDAKRSLPFQLGKVVVNRGLTLADFTPTGLQDKAAIEVAERVGWRLDASAVGSALGSGRVELELEDGRHLHAEARSLPGSVDDPIRWPDLEDKFRECAMHSVTPVGSNVIGEVTRILRSLETQENVDRIIPRLSATS